MLDDDTYIFELRRWIEKIEKMKEDESKAAKKSEKLGRGI